MLCRLFLQKAAMVGALLFFCVLISAKYSAGQGLTRLIGFGSLWNSTRTSELRGCSYYVRENSYGYDGQFYAQIALDPLLRNPALGQALDAPAYRAQRIFLPALSHVAGVANPYLILTLYSLWNILFFFLLARLLWVWMAPVDWFTWCKWFCCLFSMGVLESVRLSLTDLPAAFLVLRAIKSREEGQLAAAGLCFLLAGLTKESALLAAPALMGTLRIEAWRRESLKSLAVILPAVLAVGFWACYVRLCFPVNTGAGVILTWPLTAMTAALYDAILQMTGGDWHLRNTLRIICAGGFLLQAFWFFRHRSWDKPLWRLGMVQVLLFFCLGETVWQGPWAVGRACLLLVLAFNLLLPPGRHGWSLLLIANASALYALFRVLGN